MGKLKNKTREIKNLKLSLVFSTIIASICIIALYTLVFYLLV